MQTQIAKLQNRWERCQKESSYLGWTNKQTYLFSLTIFDQDVNYEYWMLRAQTLLYSCKEGDYTEQLGEELEKYLLECQTYDEDLFTQDLQKYYAESINFYEIAEELLSSLAYNTTPPLLH